MPAPPTGTLTFLFTDIAGSTRLWDTQHEAMRQAHGRQADLIAASVLAHNGHLVRSRGEGDSTFSVFHSPLDALAAACDFQRALLAEIWPTDVSLRVRAALHLGPAELREGDYNSTAVNRCARLRGLAAPGQTLVSQAVAERAGEILPEGLSLRALGSHRLKDLQLPEQIFQLCHPELPDDFVPLRSLDSLPTNLPQQLTRFIGREAEMGQLVPLLGASRREGRAAPRLLTLLGTGGVGKTRLALQVGAELLEDYPDGVWLVELAAVADGALAAPAAALALGLREDPGHPLLETLQDYLRGRRLLLLLDNCEHLADACAHLTETLLRACPGLTVLATSREPLQIPAETLWRIPSLSLPGEETTVSPESVQASEAGQLFLDRAQAVFPGFEATSQNAGAIAQISRRLDGIPLALELAAARMKALSVEQIAARLDDRFRLLMGGSRTALPRQQTLRALIDWSYDLLAAPEQLLLQRLSVFVGGWTLEAAETVCSGEGIAEWEALDLLTSLVDKSLVLAEAKEGQVRYRLLETIRQYAAEKRAESGEEAGLRGRHRDWYLAFAKEANAQLGGADQVRWLEALSVEHPNLRQALAFSLAEPGEAEAGMRLAGILQRYWWTHGHLTEGRGYYAAALSHPETQERTLVRAVALNGAGMLAFFQADYEAGRRLHEEALEIRREQGDRAGIAASLSSLGNLVREQGDYAVARPLMEEGLALQRELGNRAGVAVSLNNLAILARNQGAYALARTLQAECLEIRRALGDRFGIAMSLNNMGNMAYFLGDYAASRPLHEESLAIKRELGDRSGIAASLNNLGNVAHMQEDYATARVLHEESLAIKRELGERSGVAISLKNLGKVAHAQGDYALAHALQREGLAIKREAGDRLGVIESLEEIALLAYRVGQWRQAALLWGAAERLREEIGSPLLPTDRELYERHVAEMRAASDSVACAVAWAEGGVLTVEQAIALALGERA